MIGYSPIGVTPIGAIAAATASQDAAAPGASLVAASSIAGGSAVGASAGVAGGAQLVATSSMAPGAASGSRSGTASGAALVASSSMAPGAATGGSSGSIPGVITVPTSRTAKFAANPRVAVFNTTRPVALVKGALDELWFVGDFSKDLADAATTAVSVAPVSAGVAVLQDPSLQGALGLVKLGVMSAVSASFTFRVTCANGEVFDRTILLTAIDDRLWVFGKDPDDQRFYAFDFAADLALSANTTLASVGTPVVAGVTALSAPGIQGSQVVMKLGGLATASDAANSCGLPVTFANGEKIYRSIFFVKEDH